MTNENDLFKIMDAPLMQELFGKTICNIFLDESATYLLLVDQDGEWYAYKAVGDCCSETWFESISNPENIIDSPIIEVDAKDECESELKGFWNDKDKEEYIRVYGYTLKTIKGCTDIEFRNASNGYYGGWCKRVPKIAAQSPLKPKFTIDDLKKLHTLEVSFLWIPESDGSWNGEDEVVKIKSLINKKEDCNDPSIEGPISLMKIRESFDLLRQDIKEHLNKVDARISKLHKDNMSVWSHVNILWDGYRMYIDSHINKRLHAIETEIQKLKKEAEDL
jgi:hypothetical protein